MNALSIVLALALSSGQGADAPAPADSITVKLMLEDGTIAGGAQVSLFSERTMMGIPVHSALDAVADAVSGRALVEGLRSEEYQLVARWEPKRDSSRFRQNPDAALEELPATSPVWWGFRRRVSPSPEDCELVLEKGSRQLVTVRTADGEPVENVRVRMVLKSSEAFTPWTGRFLPCPVELDRRLETRDGRFVLDGLVPGEWEYVFAAEDHGRTGILSSRFPTEGDLDVSIPRFVTISGEVHLSDGVPPAECSVDIEYEDTRVWMFEDGEVRTSTDSLGKFVITSVRPGRATLRAESLVRPAVWPKKAAYIPRRVAELPLIIESGKNLESLRLVLGEPK